MLQAVGTTPSFDLELGLSHKGSALYNGAHVLSGWQLDIKYKL